MSLRRKSNFHRCETQDGSGFVSRQELSTVMNYLGMALTAEEIEVRRMKVSHLCSRLVFREYWMRRMWMVMVR